MDIIKTLYHEQHTINKLYFKVDVRDMIKDDESSSQEDEIKPRG